MVFDFSRYLLLSMALSTAVGRHNPNFSRIEFEVYQRFVDLTAGKMAVPISHRFSTVRMADRILVLEQGTLQEQGNHSQLVAFGRQVL